MAKGLFINQGKSNCSIYESGLMIKNVLNTLPEGYTLDYMETDRRFKCFYLKLKYDFYIINWHPATLPVPRHLINNLRGLKIAIVLEVSPTSSLPVTPDYFDAYMVIDPTKEKVGKIYPFPRPLEVANIIKPLLYPDRVVIGGFGLVCPTGDALAYKRFYEVIENANKIKNSLVRFNFPVGTYTGIPASMLVDYAKSLKEVAKNGTEVLITHNYMTKPELIAWCSENTANAFPYYRDNMIGLSAVTDQAISAGRPLIVTGCNTFRHIHKYINYYPKQTYEKLIATTLPGVLKMQEDWSPDNFKRTFRQLLQEKGLL